MGRRSPTEGAARLHDTCRRPFIGNDGRELNSVIKFILERHGNDDDVFSSFLAAMHNGQVLTGAFISLAPLPLLFIIAQSNEARVFADGRRSYTQQTRTGQRVPVLANGIPSSSPP